ncbi:RNA-binding protein Jag [hydrothermal vent metagenome]|uniref:RNA-binding protein Jag n=1 Tax=hydrothermal vent metagenome TaxID=652676 RepID=A0A1W1EDD1_9ZZZZ
MKKVEADTLEEAYQKAATQLACSITEMKYEVLQHPSKGIFGFLKKKAIIVATCENSTSNTNSTLEKKTLSENKSKTKEVLKKEIAEEIIEKIMPTKEESVASEILSVVKENDQNFAENDVVLDNFFAVDNEDTDDVSVVIDENSSSELEKEEKLALLIEDQLKELMSHSCFDIDVVEVDVRDNTALIFIDGEDAALLIGKEGYRYNALSYLLFNWLHAKYQLFIKLEIAEFLTSQQEMIRNYIKPVIENVNKNGKAKTRFLDGILVQIALEQLREEFPDKYVAVKSGREGKKFVVINNFNNKSTNA